MGESTTDLVRRGFDAYRQGELDPIIELLDPGVRWDGVGDQEPCLNRDQAVGVLRGQLRSGPHLELVDAVAYGDKVLVSLRRRPSGESGSLEGPERTFNVVTFDQGRIVRMQGFWDREEAVRVASAPG